MPALVASVYLVPWWRLPAWAQAAPPLLYFVIVALLRDATGADASIFTALVLLPVFWFALYGTRPQLLVSVAGVFLTLAAPALIVGAPDYPPRDELVRALLWLMIAGALGLTVHRLVLEVRARFIEYRSILETAHESFIAAGPDGRIVDWNQQAERDFGWSREEVIGRDLADDRDPAEVPGRLRARASTTSCVRRPHGPRPAVRDAGHAPRRRRVPGRDHGLGAAELTVGTGSTPSFTTSPSAGRASGRCARPRNGSAAPSTTARRGWRLVSTDGSWLQVNQALADLTGYPTERSSRGCPSRTSRIPTTWTPSRGPRPARRRRAAAVRDREAIPPRRRAPRLGLAQPLSRPRRGWGHPVPDLPDAGRHGAQADRGEARSSGHARPAHGAAQPHLVHRPDAARQGAPGARRLAGAPVLRPRPLQGGQRQLRARGGRPNPDARSRTGCARSCDPATPCPGSAATSSRCSARGWRPRRRSGSPRGSPRPSRRRS